MGVRLLAKQILLLSLFFPEKLAFSQTACANANHKAKYFQKYFVL